ncbi:MAG: exodeoxyribonuclease V subunit gamma, partial [Oscillospiraceae bacterium]|nr:exodeoxyribonuclease V subunit gamma [Oscillospiraceae bacterium]
MAQLHLLIGRANTGKSKKILEEIKHLGDESKQILLVPEHVSHKVEVDLVRYCGAKVSRHAEVLSPRLLANRVLAETGGLADGTLDAGGKLLMMQLALQETAPVLKVYARPSQKAPFLSELVTLCDELQSCHVLPERLGEVCEMLDGMSGEKLRDLSLIYASYLAQLNGDKGDRRDLMTKLLERVEASGYIDGKDIFIDGFSYFTIQEEKLISIFLHRARSVTIALMGERDSHLEIFQQSLRTRDRLLRLAGATGAFCKVIYLDNRSAQDVLQHIEKNFFGGDKLWSKDHDQIQLYRADHMFSEVEYVASEILRLVRSGKYRFHDISVAARNMDDYSAAIENIFERYDIPFYLSHRSDILEKPVLSLIAGVLDSISGGYEYEDMFHWLKTGLAGLTDEECDLLENYVIQWDIHGTMWIREEDWNGNPDGWCEGFSQEQEEMLAKINAIRQRIGAPIRHLAQGLKAETGAKGKLTMLWRFLEEIRLPDQLEERTTKLEELGELQQAGEYSQLWELLCGVMDQFADTLQDMPMDQEQFTRLMKLLLTQYDIGTIPASLDQVQITQITRNDRHRVKCLFLIGCNDHVLPSVPSNMGLLNREDRSQLLDCGIELAPSGLDLLDIELQNLYAALAQPTDRLCVTWPASDFAGNHLRPSFVLGRIRTLVPGIVEQMEQGDHHYRLSAPIPALEMVGEHRGGSLWQYFSESGHYSEQLSAMERAAGMS